MLSFIVLCVDCVCMMRDIDLIGSDGVFEFELVEIELISDELEAVPEWVDFEREVFCKIISFDGENPRFLLTVSDLVDEYRCQVEFVMEDGRWIVYVIPTENMFVTYNLAE